MFSDYKFIKSKYSHNFGNIQNTPELNEEVYQNFINKQDFANAAEYLSQFHFTDPSVNYKHKQRINQLRIESHKQQAITSNMTDDQRDAYAFDYAMKNNLSLPTESVVTGKQNAYTQKYRNAVNSLFGEDSQQIVFDIKNINQNTFWGGIKEFFTGDADKAQEAFYDALGIRRDKYMDGLSNMGAVVQQANGKTSIKIDKSNLNFLKFLRAAKEVNPDAISMYGIAKDAKGNDEIRGYSDKSFEYLRRNHAASFNKPSDPFRDDYMNPYEMIDNIITVPEEAARIGSQDLNQSNYNQELVERSIVISPYMSAQHARLEEYRNAGLISREDYNSKKQELDDEAMRLLVSNDFSEQQLFAAVAEDGRLDEIKGTDKRKFFHDLINTAVNEGQKITVSHGNVGGVPGTFVDIPAFIEKKKDIAGIRMNYDTNTGGADDKYLGNESKMNTYRIFLPMFYGGEAEEDLYHDPKMVAIRTLAVIDDYKYQHELSGNRSLKSLGDGQYEYTTTAGYTGRKGSNYRPYGVETQVISKEQAQQLLVEEESAGRVAEMIQMAASDQDGNLNPQLVKKFMLDRSDYIKRAVTTLYGITDEQALKVYGEEFFKNLSRILGIDINSL